MLLSIRDEIPNPNINDAISQLEILARRGYFSIPYYEFEQEYDAKKQAAYQMLKYALL